MAAAPNAGPNYIIARSKVEAARYIDTRGLIEQVNNYIKEGYVVSGNMCIQPIPLGFELFQTMTKNPSQGGGTGTKRRRIRKNARTYNRIRQ